MKYALMFVTLLLCGCPTHQAPVAVNHPAGTPDKGNCAPNVTKEMNIIPATITDVRDKPDQTWSDTHSVSCPENYRTVIPSGREIFRAGDIGDTGRWIAEHEFCEPDGLQ